MFLRPKGLRVVSGVEMCVELKNVSLTKFYLDSFPEFDLKVGYRHSQY
jgi:hypothetical protein